MLIGAFKLAKGALLVALAFGVLRLGPAGIAGALERWTSELQIDPDGQHLGRVVPALMALDDRRLKTVTAGIIVYGAVLWVEGIGLLLRKRWAEYFTAIVTASFLPVELYEVVRHPGRVRVAVLVVNGAILWYLVRRLRRGG